MAEEINYDMLTAYVKDRDNKKQTYALKNPDEESTIVDIGEGIARGPFEALKNSAVTITRWMGDDETSVEEIAPFSSSILKMIEEPTTSAGKVAESMSTFLSSWLALRGAGGTTTAGALITGAIADSLIWDEDDGRISDVLADAGIQNAVVDYLKHDPSDSKAEDSLKNVIEGGLAGIASEYIIKGVTQGYKVGKAALWKNRSPEEVKALVDTKPIDEVIQPLRPAKAVEPGVKIAEGKPPETAFNYTRLNLDEDSKSLLEGIANSAEMETYFKTGVKPQAVTKAEAEKLVAVVGDDYLEFAKQTVKDIKNADDKLVALKMIMGDKVTNLTRFVKEAQPGDNIAIVKALKDLQELYVITGGTKAVQTTAARTTAAGRINIVPDEVIKVIDEMDEVDELLMNKELSKFLDKTTAKKIKKTISKIIDVADDVKLHQGVRALDKNVGAFAKLGNVLNEVRSTGLLSGPVTLGINVTGNTIVRGAARIEDYLAYGIGKVFNTKDKLLWDELQAMSNGRFTSIMGTFEAIGKAAKQWRSGPKAIEETLEDNYLDFYQKYDTASNKAISSDYLMNITDESGVIIKGLGHTIDTVGAAIRLPYHALGVTDDMFKRSIYSGQISYIGTRQANMLKLTGEAKHKYISEFIYAHNIVFDKKLGKALSKEQQELVNKYILSNKGKWHLEALEKARELTFQEELRSGKGASSINKTLSWIDNIRTSNPIGEFIVPFYRTPVNLVKWVGRRTPGVHRLSQTMMDDIKAGGRRRNLAYARLSMGTSLYALGGMLAADGILIGGSRNENERKARAAAGIQDYSVKIGDKTIPANRLDPVVMPLFMAADLYAFHDDMTRRGLNTLDGYMEHFDEVSGTMIMAFTNNVLNKTWLKSVSDIINAIKYKNTEYMARSLTTFAPYSSMNRFVEQTDNYKEAKGVMENFMKLYEPHTLRDSLDIFGKATAQTKVIGLPYSEITDSPVRKELVRLQMGVSKFDNKISYRHTEIELEPEDHWKMQNYVNTVFKLEEKLNSIVKSSSYKNAPDGIDFSVPGTKKYFINTAISQARDKARKYYLKKNKKSLDEYMKERQKNLDTLDNQRKSLADKWLEKGN